LINQFNYKIFYNFAAFLERFIQLQAPEMGPLPGKRTSEAGSDASLLRLTILIRLSDEAKCNT
jgi:hypothetical protein